MRNTAESGYESFESVLSGKKILLGVTGSIAAYKAAYIASALVKRGADVHVVMTEHATRLIGPATFWSITSNPVITEMFTPPPRPEITHVSLPESVDLCLIAPATANIIGKIANGIADDMLSTMAMVVRCPAVIAPAMNDHMYEHPAVRANMSRLRTFGWVIIEPEEGRLACGDEGRGRLAEPDNIVKVVEELLTGGPKDYAGIDVLVSAGPTHEPIDPVRYITNRSSGKMGYAIAAEAAARGAKVTLVSGPTSLDAPPDVETVRVETVQEMLDAIMARVDNVKVFISAAAPADFRPARILDQKIKKAVHYTLDLDQTEDILAKVGASKGRMVLVGFAAETEELEAHAEGKLLAKNLDLIVANNVSPGSDVFGSDSNQVTLISSHGNKVEWPRMSKREVAKGILDYIKNNYWEEMS